MVTFDLEINLSTIFILIILLIIILIAISKFIKLIVDLHEYEIISKEKIIDKNGNTIGAIYILRCKRCGKLKKQQFT